MEELGKMFLLLHVIQTKSEITQKKWDDKFKDHRKKIRFITEYLQMCYNNNPHEDIYKLSRRLERLGEEKTKAFYVDWDNGAGKWRYYDRHEPDKQKIAEYALKYCEKLVVISNKIFDEDDSGDPEEIIKLFRSGKAYAFCKNCGLCMMTPTELKWHGGLCGINLNWHKLN